MGATTLRSFRALVGLVLLVLLSCPVWGQTTTQIHGLTASGGAAATDEFATDKDVAGVWRTRKLTVAQLESYFEAATLTLTGAAILDASGSLKVILPSGATPTSTACDEVGEEDGRVFVDTDAGVPQVCVCNGASGWVCGSMFGSSIDDTELTAEDFGDFTCTGSEDGCTVDASVIATSDILDGTILEADLSITNSATVSYCLISDGGTGFTWAACSGAGDRITEGNTTLEVQDAGTGSIVLTVDAVGTITFDSGGIVLDDGVTDSPQVGFNPASGTFWRIFAQNSDDDLQLSANSGSTENVDIANVGAGVANLTVDGTVAAATVTGANVTSGADPGHTHTAGAISTDNIAEGDSKVEVVDAGTGKVEVTIDGAIDWTFDPNVFRATNAAGPALVDEAASNTNPTLIPNRAALDDGIGHGGSGVAVIESGGVVATFDVSQIASSVPILVDDGLGLRLGEANANGTDFNAFLGANSLSGTHLCTLLDNDRQVPGTCIEDVYLLNSGDTSTGELNFSDGVTDSPKSTYTPATGPAISLYALDSVNGGFTVETNDGSDTLLLVENAGAGEADAWVRGDLVVDDLAQANSVELVGSGDNDRLANATNHIFYDEDGDDVEDAGEDDLSVDDDDPESINLTSASMVTDIADDQVLVGASANTAAFQTVPNCTTGKLLYTQSTNTWSCGTDAVGVGGNGTGEYNPDNYPPAADILLEDEFTTGVTLTWTEQNSDSAVHSQQRGGYLISNAGTTDQWHAATTDVPADSGQDWFMVAKVRTSAGLVATATRGCGISLITGGTAGTPTEINTLYIRASGASTAAVEHLDHDDYDFGGTTSMSSTSVYTSSITETMQKGQAIYLALWWIDATEDIAARWSWDGFTWVALTSDTTVDGYPVAMAIGDRDDEWCQFEFVRVLDTDVDGEGSGTTFLRIGQ